MIPFVAFLGSPLGKYVGYALIALVLLATVAGVKHEWNLGQAARKQVATIAHVSRAEVRAVAKIDSVSVKKAEAAQTRIVVRTRTLIKKVPTYVSTSVPCVPWGVVRVHDAAVLGVDPSTLQPPAGQADDACSDVDPRSFVASVVSNYGAAEANAEQLNALEALLRQRAAATNPGAP